MGHPLAPHTHTHTHTFINSYYNNCQKWDNSYVKFNTASSPNRCYYQVTVLTGRCLCQQADRIQDDKAIPHFYMQQNVLVALHAILRVCLGFIVCLNNWEACSVGSVVWHAVWVLNFRPVKRLLQASTMQMHIEIYISIFDAIAHFEACVFGAFLARHYGGELTQRANHHAVCCDNVLCLFCVRPLMSNIIFALFPSCRLLENSAILDQYERASMKYENMERKFAPAWFWWWWWRDTGEKDIANELKSKNVWQRPRWET